MTDVWTTTETRGAPVKTWPVFRLDFNQTWNPGPGRWGVWFVVSDFEVEAWGLRAGREVIVEDYDEAEDLRFFGAVIDIQPAKKTGRWRVRVDYDERAPR